MKKLLCIASSILMIAALASCSGEDETFRPALDVQTSCNIKVVGDYGNFEALESEFDKFNEYYPNVQLEYTKIDDYKNTLATVLEGSDKPNIFFSYTWMMGNDKYNPVVAHMENISESVLKNNLNCIRPSLINKDKDGNVLMVPVFSRTYGTLVNEKIFEKEGLSVPKKWSELLSTCATLKEKGYSNPMMGYSLKNSSGLMNTIAYPQFIAELADKPEALKKANDLDPSAGEYMRSALTSVKAIVDNGCVDLNQCDQILDNYNLVILRFFEGDVPMMICAGDIVSGTKKRESQSEAFVNSPFNYSFHPIPVTEQGGYFIDSPSVEFSVNKNCENIEMTNEFMRFLLSTKELNEMASLKGLVTPTKQMAVESVYSPFMDVPSERVISPEVIGVKDSLATQIRIASFEVGRGNMSIDEAISKYGTFK